MTVEEYAARRAAEFRATLLRRLSDGTWRCTAQQDAERVRAKVREIPGPAEGAEAWARSPILVEGRCRVCDRCFDEYVPANTCRDCREVILAPPEATT